MESLLVLFEFEAAMANAVSINPKARGGSYYTIVHTRLRLDGGRNNPQSSRFREKTNRGALDGLARGYRV
jgi:hypothetical protein